MSGMVSGVGRSLWLFLRPQERTALLSFHLKELVQAGLVTQERQGRNLIYRASFDSMNELLGYLTQNCCTGEACLTADATACTC